jgi:hypothetical protein
MNVFTQDLGGREISHCYGEFIFPAVGLTVFLIIGFALSSFFIFIFKELNIRINYVIIYILTAIIIEVILQVTNSHFHWNSLGIILLPFFSRCY